MGETCGKRMIYETVPMPEVCPVCKQIETKLRRLAAAQEKYRRWEHDRSRQASKAKIQEEMGSIAEEISQLQRKRSGEYRIDGYTCD